jgi:hypothetical protein
MGYPAPKNGFTSNASFASRAIVVQQRERRRRGSRAPGAGPIRESRARMAEPEVQLRDALTAREAQALVNELVWLLRRVDLPLARALLADVARKLGWDPAALLGAPDRRRDRE